MAQEMNDKFQRDIFRNGEGDAWLARNIQSSHRKNKKCLEDDPLLPLLNKLNLQKNTTTRLVEVGCGQGLRLKTISDNFGWNVTGLDPSVKSIKSVKEFGLDGYVGTAEELPFEDSSLDVLVYGFCLYLCDRVDLFNIASEAHRVLKSRSWIAILDFWTPNYKVNKYHHLEGVYSHKTNPSSMFDWHPSYVVTDHYLTHIDTRKYTDNPDNWVASTLLRRCDEWCKYND